MTLYVSDIEDPFFSLTHFHHVSRFIAKNLTNSQLADIFQKSGLSFIEE